MESEKALAFRLEFYEQAGKAQIKDDIVSFLGEYRFEVPDFEYAMSFSGGKLADPNTKDSMVSKAQKAIELRKTQNLNTDREQAEFEGLVSLENQLLENPTGTAIWFSPPGAKKDGYGDYGFAYTGKKEGDKVRMSAIRLESPSMTDFNLIARTVWDQEGEMSAEDFLKTPKVLDIPEDKAREFIYGVFEIKPKEAKAVFQKALDKMDSLIDECSVVLRYGTEDEKKTAMAVLQNVAIEIRQRLSVKDDEKVIFLSDFKTLKLNEAMHISRYASPPPAVAGSCGMTGKIESSNFLGKLLGSSENNLFSKSERKWFTCPDCKYEANGPVGNQCPSCGLTKEKYVEKGGEKCE